LGIFSAIFLYKIAKRRGRRQCRREGANNDYDERDSECVNYASFCENFGSCDGMECEFED
jgi:hypothetical protein